MLEEINGTQLQKVLLQVQEQLRGPAPQNELIAMDGKEPKHGGGQSVLTAVCVPSQYYLGSAMVDTKTNEIPVAQKLFPDLDLKGRFVSLDALHTQTQTARDIVLEGGADYLLTVKDNQQKLHQNIEKLLPAPRAGDKDSRKALGRPALNTLRWRSCSQSAELGACLFTFSTVRLPELLQSPWCWKKWPFASSRTLSAGVTMRNWPLNIT
jgi:hypothetical protein